MHLPPTKVFRQLTASLTHSLTAALDQLCQSPSMYVCITASVNENIVKPHVAAAVGRKTILKPRLAAATYNYMWDFPDIQFRVAWLIR